MNAQLHLIDGLAQDNPPPPPKYIFQERLLIAQAKKGASDADMVRATGIAFSTWMQWVRGLVEAPVAGEDFKAVCRFLGVTADYILGMDK